MTTDELAAGWDALRRGDWREARICFERAGDAPEALEGLGWAGTGLNTHDLIFEARERAYRAYRDRGDESSAGRVAGWLAADYLEIRGEPAVASGWLQRAHTHLDDLEPGPDHGWLAVIEADDALLNGDTVTARRLAARAIELGRRFRVPELEMVGLGIDGSALVSEGELPAGMRRLDEATAAALAGDAQLLVCVGWACCYLIAACEEVRDYDRAGQWCGRVGAFAERYGITVLLGVCRAKYGSVLTSHGRWDEAGRELEAAAESLSTSRPALVGEALVRLAELRRRQGRHAEAERLLSEHDHHSRALLGRAAVALDLGRLEEAADLADRYLRRFPDAVRIERAAALELAVRARARLGHDDCASEALGELRALATRIGTRPLQAAALAAEAAVAVARGDHDAARRSFEDAVDTYAGCGLPFDAACARLELAIVLDALGREDAARRETEAALDALQRLGAAHEVARAETLLGRRRDGPFADLSPRELEVLSLVAAGLTNAEIASRLVLS